jgi:CheY-like chemotaxis protein
MAGENISIEVTNGFLQNFFGLADMMPPDDVTVDDLNKAVKTIKQKIDNAILSQSAMGSSSTSLGMGGLSSPAENEYLKGGEVNDGVVRSKNVLIVDDLGIITYQLEILFKKLGFEVTVSRELYDAIDNYKKKDFGYVILDLFIPTEREGFILLDEIKKLSLFCKLNTKIIMMSASAKNEYKDKCINRGADAYIEKTTGWQKSIIDACLGKGGQ